MQSECKCIQNCVRFQLHVTNRKSWMINDPFVNQNILLRIVMKWQKRNNTYDDDDYSVFLEKVQWRTMEGWAQVVIREHTAHPQPSNKPTHWQLPNLHSWAKRQQHLSNLEAQATYQKILYHPAGNRLVLLKAKFIISSKSLLRLSFSVDTFFAHHN